MRKAVSAAWVAFAVGTLGACASKPYTSDSVVADAISSRAQRVPLQNWTSTTPLLECVGDQMRVNRVAPLLVGWGVSDTSGKTAVDQGMMVRSALHKIARRGAGIRVTSMGVSPISPDARSSIHASAEQQLRQSKSGTDRYELAAPDLIIEGGVSSILGAARYDQKSAGVSARDFELSSSKSRSYDVAFASYTLKRFRDGVDINGASVDLRVIYQQGSASTDVGGYVALRQDGKKHGAGLRFGDNSGFNESPEESLRVAVETAVAILFADLHSLDLSVCPAQSPPLDAEDTKQGKPLTHNQVAAFFNSMSPAARVTWVQRSLAAKNYDVGPVDGHVGPRTRSAISAFERDAKIPPSGGRVELPLLAAVANERIARGDDIREAPSTFTPQPLQIVLSAPSGVYLAGNKLRAQAIASQAGYLACALNSPDDGVVIIHPLMESRSTFISARSPVHLLSAVEGPGHPSATLAVGRHEIFCLQARTPINLQKRGNPAGKAGWAETITAMRKAAGQDLMSDAVIGFDVRPSR